MGLFFVATFLPKNVTIFSPPTVRNLADLIRELDKMHLEF